MAFRTSRTFTVRGRPPRLAGGISEPTSAHSASVKSLSYLRPRRSAAARCSGFHMRHLSPTQVPHKESQPIRPTQLLSGSALRNPRSFVCFGVVLLEGMAIYGITPFIGDLLRARDAGGVREAGFVIGGLGIGGLVYAAVLPVILRFAKRTVMMATGGAIAGVGLAGAGLDITWTTHMAFMVVLGFGFFLLHNSVQTEVTELAPSARASSFSLHAFSFFLGQALGPMVYGMALPTIGATISLSLCATLLVATGVVANLALRPLPGSRRAAVS